MDDKYINKTKSFIIETIRQAYGDKDFEKMASFYEMNYDKYKNVMAGERFGQFFNQEDAVNITSYSEGLKNYFQLKW